MIRWLIKKWKACPCGAETPCEKPKGRYVDGVWFNGVDFITPKCTLEKSLLSLAKAMQRFEIKQ